MRGMGGLYTTSGGFIVNRSAKEGKNTAFFLVHKHNAFVEICQMIHQDLIGQVEGIISTCLVEQNIGKITRRRPGNVLNICSFALKNNITRSRINSMGKNSFIVIIIIKINM